MERSRILVIEDDAAIRCGLLDALECSGYETRGAARGDEGLELALMCECDLILLDLMLPGVKGLDILKRVRAERATLPVIILTAMGDETDRVKGLRLGADDYMVKPFSVKEMMARVEAVLRRSPERPLSVTEVDFDGGRVDVARCEVLFDDGVREGLTEREVELLTYLAENAGRVISRDEILRRVWRLEPKGLSTRTIDMHIARLREKLRDNTDRPALIATVRGRGYMFGREVDV